MKSYRDHREWVRNNIENATEFSSCDYLDIHTGEILKKDDKLLDEYVLHCVLMNRLSTSMVWKLMHKKNVKLSTEDSRIVKNMIFELGEEVIYKSNKKYEN